MADARRCKHLAQGCYATAPRPVPELGGFRSCERRRLPLHLTARDYTAATKWDRHQTELIHGRLDHTNLDLDGCGSFDTQQRASDASTHAVCTELAVIVSHHSETRARHQQMSSLSTEMKMTDVRLWEIVPGGSISDGSISCRLTETHLTRILWRQNCCTHSRPKHFHSTSSEFLSSISRVQPERWSWIQE